MAHIAICSARKVRKQLYEMPINLRKTYLSTILTNFEEVCADFTASHYFGKVLGKNAIVLSFVVWLPSYRNSAAAVN